MLSVINKIKCKKAAAPDELPVQIWKVLEKNG